MTPKLGRVGGRGQHIAPFYVMEVMKAAAEREANGDDVMHMEVGEPGTGAPAAAVAAAHAALHDNVHLGYSDALGIPPLRARVARHYQDTYGVDVDPGRIVVTTGSSAGFVLAFLAAFDDGAKIGAAEPGYPAYRNTASALGFNPVAIAVGSETRFQPSTTMLAAGPAMDGLVIASPANPTGTMLDRPALRAIVDWAAANDVPFQRNLSRHVRVWGGDRDPLWAPLTMPFSQIFFHESGWRRLGRGQRCADAFQTKSITASRSGGTLGR